MQSSGFSIKRWPSELPLFWISVLSAALIWGLLAFSLFTGGKPVILFLGIYISIYLVMMFLIHLAIISHIRGNGIRVTDSQLPELYNVIDILSKRFGLKKTPETYILQGNGVLNAFATKFACSRIFVLNSNLVEAVSNHPAARDMVIGHELGHMRAGHLRWFWFLLPSYFVPFLGMALSRAREYTADRYGAACVENKEQVNEGLMILAAGKEIAPKVQLRNFAAQINNVNTGWMRLGEWFSTHPTLVRRVCALDKSLSVGAENFGWSFFKGICILIFGCVILSVGFGFAFIQAAKSLPNSQQQTTLSDQDLGLTN